MKNLRIISDNAADRATVTAAPVAPGMSAASMLSDVMSNVCRSTGTSLSITMIWNDFETIGAWHAPWWNGSPTSTVRVRGYSDAEGATEVLDTGVQPASPAPAIKLRGNWTAAASASAYAYGGGAHASVWFANTSIKRLDVDLVDVDNLQGYVEVSRIVVGQWWEPEQNADYNPSLSSAGLGENFRDGAGRRRSTRGAKYRKMSIQLSHMSEADRMAMWEIILGNGTEIPLLFSLYPDDQYPARERDHQMYCGLVANAGMRRPSFKEHATQLDLESI